MSVATRLLIKHFVLGTKIVLTGHFGLRLLTYDRSPQDYSALTKYLFTKKSNSDDHDDSRCFGHQKTD